MAWAPKRRDTSLPERADESETSLRHNDRFMEMFNH
jgi:hypothetical protein